MKMCCSSNVDLPQCSGRIALITGGTRGIGLEVIKMLLQCDIHVIIGTVNLLHCKIVQITFTTLQVGSTMPLHKVQGRIKSWP